MSKDIIAYIATSLDGKIADQQGGVEWLHSVPNPEESDYGYASFMNTIDTILMGNATYQQVLGFEGPFPYTDTDNYVITRDTSLTKDQYATYISRNVVETIRELKLAEGKRIWCMGGGQLISLLIEHALLDELQLFIMPVILGNGIPLSGPLKSGFQMKLVDSTQYVSGVMELRYSTH